MNRVFGRAFREGGRRSDILNISGDRGLSFRDSEFSVAAADAPRQMDLLRVEEVGEETDRLRGKGRKGEGGRALGDRRMR